MYEIEKKFEIQPEQLTTTQNNILNLGYTLSKQVNLTDYYPVFSESKIKPNSFNFERYRQKNGGKIIKTIKTWVEVEGTFQRFEEENEFVGEIPNSKYILNKTRDIYNNLADGMPEITIDILDFGDGKFKYFIEAELVTEDKAKLKEFEIKVLSVLSQVLGRDVKTEKQAPSMLHLLMENIK